MSFCRHRMPRARTGQGPDDRRARRASTTLGVAPGKRSRMLVRPKQRIRLGRQRGVRRDHAERHGRERWPAAEEPTPDSDSWRVSWLRSARKSGNFGSSSQWKNLTLRFRFLRQFSTRPNARWIAVPQFSWPVVVGQKGQNRLLRLRQRPRFQNPWQTSGRHHAARSMGPSRNATPAAGRRGRIRRGCHDRVERLGRGSAGKCSIPIGNHCASRTTSSPPIDRV